MPYASEKQLKQIAGEINNKFAKKEGVYPNLTAGNLIDKNAEPVEREFTFDTACGAASIQDDGTAIITKIKGNTHVVNQMVAESGSFTVSGDGIVNINNAIAGSSDSVIFEGKSSQASYIGYNIFDTHSALEQKFTEYENYLSPFDTSDLVDTLESIRLLNQPIYYNIENNLGIAGAGVLKIEYTNGRSVELIPGEVLPITSDFYTIPFTGNFSQFIFYGTDPASDMTFSNAIIKISDSYDGEYEPYVGGIPAPNPYYPQEIKANDSVWVSSGINIYNANETKITNLEGFLNAKRPMPCGANLLLQTVVVGELIQFATRANAIVIPCKSNETFTISSFGEIYSPRRIYVECDKNGVVLVKNNYSSFPATITTVDSNCEFLVIEWGLDDVSDASKIVVTCGGTVPTEYIEYFDGGSIDLSNNPLYETNGSLVGIKTDIFNSVSGTITRNCKKVILSGDENYTSRSDRLREKSFTFYIDDDKILNPFNKYFSGTYCTHLIDSHSASWNEDKPNTFTMGLKDLIVISFAHDVIGTDPSSDTFETALAKAKAYIKSQYEAGTPITFIIPIEPITETVAPQQITIPEGNSIFRQTYGSIDNTHASVTYRSNHYNLPLIGSRKYIYRNNTTETYITATTGQTLEVDSTDQLIDLTKMFGSGNEPTSISEFYKYYPLLINDIPYEEGKLVSYNGTGIETIGFNQWDEQWENGEYNNITGEKSGIISTSIRTKNFNPCFENTDYYFNFYNSQGGIVILWYDANKTYISLSSLSTPGIKRSVPGARYFTFYLNNSTYNNDITVNLSWSGYKDGLYEPYSKHDIKFDVSHIQKHCTFTYIVGGTDFASEWLSLTDGGPALTPESGVLYKIKTVGDYFDKIYKWNGSSYVEADEEETLVFPYGMLSVSNGAADEVTENYAKNNIKILHLPNNSIKFDVTDINSYGFIQYTVNLYDKKCGVNAVANIFGHAKSNANIMYIDYCHLSAHNVNRYIGFSIEASKLSGDLSTAAGREAAFNKWLEENPITVYYETETPIITTFDDNPITGSANQTTPLDLTYYVNDFGTERSKPDNLLPMPITTPFRASIAYSSNMTREIVNLHSAINKITDGNLISSDSSESGKVSDSGISVSSINNLIQRVPIVPSTSAGNIIIYDSVGNLIDSGINLGSLITDWSQISKLVKSGLARYLFPIGHMFTVHDSDENVDNKWRVVKYTKEYNAAGDLQDAMWLEMANTWSAANKAYKECIFNARQAFYCAESGLTAGTYHFTVKEQPWSGDNDKVFQFTLVKAVPAGGQLVFDGSYDKTLDATTLKSYASGTSTAVIETSTITLGSDGVDLGYTNGISPGMNHSHRDFFGSNNYYQSTLRQILNNNNTSFTFTPQTIWDRPSYSTTWKGFMHGQPDDFKNVIATISIPCRTNNIYECNSLDGTIFTKSQTYNITTDKIFVLSYPEIYGKWESTALKDGEICDYYIDSDNEFKIKRDLGGTARSYWLRSPNPSYSDYERYVSTSGAISSYSAISSRGAVPACVIM